MEEHEALLDKEEAEEEAARQHKLELKHAKVAEAKSAGIIFTGNCCLISIFGPIGSYRKSWENGFGITGSRRLF